MTTTEQAMQDGPKKGTPGKHRRLAGNALSLIAAMAAALSVAVSFAGYRTSRRECQASVFLQLRERYIAIANDANQYEHRNLDFMSREVRKNYSDEYKHFRNYWYQCFNEWALTQHFAAKETSELWIGFYRDAIQDALEEKSFETSFRAMVTEKKFQAPLELKFVKVMEGLMPSRSGGIEPQ